jgi:hypothetical protein
MKVIVYGIHNLTDFDEHRLSLEADSIFFRDQFPIGRE